MSRVLIPYCDLKPKKGITYSKPHLWRLEQQHKEALRKAEERKAEALRKAQSGERDTDSGDVDADKPSAPLFPLRVPIGPSRYAYIEEEIDTYVDALIAARDTGVAPVPVRKPGKRPAPAPELMRQARAASALLHEPDKPLPDSPRKKRAAPAAAEPV
jgi:hypothetical protein